MLLILADDDRESAEMLAALLRLLIPPPIEIVLAFDGEQAVAAATSLHTPDVVILDIEMPRMNGLTAAVRIRSELGSRAPMLIAVTGHPGMTRLAGASAFDHVLMKPVEVDHLMALIRSH